MLTNAGINLIGEIRRVTEGSTFGSKMVPTEALYMATGHPAVFQ